MPGYVRAITLILTSNPRPMDLRKQLQSTLGDAFTVERELDGAGMSRVFVAEERALGRKVVVKILPADMAGAVSAERFRREIQLAATLQHPNIVPVLRAGDSAQIPFYTMPFVEGESLRAVLATRPFLPLSEAIRLLRDIASALAYAHKRHVVHRDIKPENVLLSSGVAVVTDFVRSTRLKAARWRLVLGAILQRVTGKSLRALPRATSAPCVPKCGRRRDRRTSGPSAAVNSWARSTMPACRD